MELRNITKVEEGTYEVSSLPCPKCEQSLTVQIGGQQLFQYNQGASILAVLPDTNDDDRERFITGYCPTCWVELFGGWDDDEEGEEND
jgi:hypothetical protein